LPRTLSYIIDINDIIISANHGFGKFASENNAKDLAKSIIGESIWKFIYFDEVHRLYQRLFEAIRKTDKEITLNFRCDSHNVLRFMKMYIEPIGENNLQIKTKLIRQVDRTKMLSREILFLGIHSGTPMCSHCNKIYINEKSVWLEIDEAIEKNLIGRELSVNFKMCEDCINEFNGIILELE
jgi:hypothetical protein